MIDKLNYSVRGREKHKRKKKKYQEYIWFFAYITDVYYYHKQEIFFVVEFVNLF